MERTPRLSPDRFSPPSAKYNRHHAFTLADAVHTDRRFSQKLQTPTHAVVEFREWTRIANTLTAEKRRLVDRLRQQLWRYFPPWLN